MLLWNDDLDGWNVLGAFDRVVDDTDASDYFLKEFDSLFESALESISGIAYDGGAMGSSIRAFDSYDLSIFEEDLIDVSVEHESASVDCTDPGESFRNTSESIDRVDEG